MTYTFTMMSGRIFEENKITKQSIPSKDGNEGRAKNVNVRVCLCVTL